MNNVTLVAMKVVQMKYNKNENFRSSDHVLERRHSFHCKFKRFNRAYGIQDIVFTTKVGEEAREDELFYIELVTEARYHILGKYHKPSLEEYIVEESIPRRLIPFAWSRISNLSALSNRFIPYDIGFDDIVISTEEEGILDNLKSIFFKKG